MAEGRFDGALVEGFVGHQREGEGFLRVFGNAELRRRERSRFVARAAASWARISGLRAPPPETMSWWILCLGRTKRCRASTTESAVKIVTARIRSAGLARWRRPADSRIFYVDTAVVFAAGTFWRREFQVWIAHEFVDERGDGAASLGKGGVFVVALAAVREVLDQGVDEHVGGAGVEGEDLRRLARQPGAR